MMHTYDLSFKLTVDRETTSLTIKGNGKLKKSEIRHLVNIIKNSLDSNNKTPLPADWKGLESGDDFE